MNLSIITPNRNDIENLYHALKNCGDSTRHLYYPHGYTTDDASRICLNPAQSHIKHYIIRLDNDIISFGFIDVNKKTFGFAVIDKFQNKGIGSIFIDFILYYAKIHGFKTIKAEGGTHVESHMKDLLIKKGFKITGALVLKDRISLMMEKVL